MSVDLPLAARVVEASPERPYLCVRVGLDPAAVGELPADAPPLPPSRASALGLAVTPAKPLLLDAVGRLVALLVSPRDFASLAPLVLRETAHRVLTGPHGSRLRQIASNGAPAQRIARAVRWLKEHFVDSLTVESLAKHAHMSPSAFRLHFKGVTAMSPLQYQKRLRLQEARRLMLGEGLDAAEAAFRVGYESPSQFSREYRRTFGAPTGRTWRPCGSNRGPRRDSAAAHVVGTATNSALPASKIAAHGGDGKTVKGDNGRGSSKRPAKRGDRSSESPPPIVRLAPADLESTWRKRPEPENPCPKHPTAARRCVKRASTP